MRGVVGFHVIDRGGHGADRDFNGFTWVESVESLSPDLERGAHHRRSDMAI